MGRVSSHFFRRARHVQHPVLVRVTPDLGDLFVAGGVMLYELWLVKDAEPASGIGTNRWAIAFALIRQSEAWSVGLICHSGKATYAILAGNPCWNFWRVGGDL